MKKTTPAATQAKPFVKWAGGKRKLAERILALAPKRFERYFEPFVGGGAVFFALRNAGFTGPATLSDVNPELVIACRIVRDSPEDLIRALGRHVNDEEAFYEVREQVPEQLGYIERAARFIYLQKTGFNGVYRVNKAGQYNVPFGHHANPKICDEDVIFAASKALRNTTILCQPFTSLAADVDEGDFVYCDPPYVPVSPTANFTVYSAEGFGLEDQQLLAQAARMWARRGATVVLSNADVPLVRELYAGMKVKRVRMARAINSNGARRGKVNEVLAVAAPQLKRRAA